MNPENYYVLSLFLAAAFVVLAFCATHVLEQRNAARRQIEVQRDTLEQTRDHYKDLKALLEKVQAERDQALVRAAENIAAYDRAAMQNAEHCLTIERMVRDRVLGSEPLELPKLEEMDPDEFREAFDVDADSPLWQAVHQLLDSAIVKAVEAVEPAPSAVFGAEGRTHAAGELSSLRDLQKDLLRWQREARRAKSLRKAEATAVAGE